MARVKDKVVVITGGSGGIGTAAGKRFAEEGAKVLLVDVFEDQLKRCVGQIGDSASYFVADVTKEDQVNAYTQAAVDRYGRVDAVILNAGIEGIIKPLIEHTKEEFDRVISVNIGGVFMGVKAAVPALAKTGGGSIIIVSSIAGLKGFALLGPYVTSKHAVVGMMRTAAIEYAGLNVRVNTVHPCPIETRMMRSIEEGAANLLHQDEKAIYGMFEGTQALKRYGKPEEVANMFLFLASDDAAFLTGNCYAVDGGHMAGLIL
ncbi:MAG: SDR family oxidoreductase [Deltaproteobacteria bacterium]|nr:SDR family oxidoreductase [Deltaproteobacteria bacterium]